MEEEWYALQELVFRLLHVDMCLGRRRSPRRGLLLVHDVQLMIAHDELLNKLLPQLKKWLAAKKECRRAQYFYYMMVMLLIDQGMTHPTEFTLDSLDY